MYENSLYNSLHRCQEHTVACMWWIFHGQLQLHRARHCEVTLAVLANVQYAARDVRLAFAIAGNTLEPMHDGKPRREVSGAEDIVDLSKSLRLGPFEAVLNSHEGPVKVVCALGQQSVGKSYQLNHLGGTFFDVAGASFKRALHKRGRTVVLVATRALQQCCHQGCSAERIKHSILWRCRSSEVGLVQGVGAQMVCGCRRGTFRVRIQRTGRKR